MTNSGETNIDNVFDIRNTSFSKESKKFIINENHYSPSELHEKFLEWQQMNPNGTSSGSLDIDDTEFSISGNLGAPPLPEVESRLLGVSSTDLFHNNKKLQDKNIDLEKKIDQLQRSLEIAEDEMDHLKKQISINEKQLRCYNDELKNRGFLESEMDRLQSELGMAEERKVKYECQIKHLKSEKEDLLFDIKSYKEQVYSRDKEVQSLSVTNKHLCEENSFLKSRLESLEVDVEIKEKELDQKLQLYQEVRGQSEEYRNAMQNLLEEKKTLINQLQEAQMEASMFQQNVGHSSSPLRSTSSLQAEIAEAEQGRNYMTTGGSSLSSHPVTPLRSSLNISIGSNYSFKKAESLTQVILHLNESSDHDDITNSDYSATAEVVSKHDTSEEDAHVKQVLSQSKEKEHYLVHQLGQKQAKIRELVLLNEKRITEIALLCDIIHKLGSTKLDAWLNDSKELKLLLQGSEKRSNYVENKDSVDCFEEDELDKGLEENFSRLVDALSLESMSSKRATYLDSSSSSSELNNSLNDSTQRFLEKAEDVVEFSKSSLGPRLDILEKTKNVIEEAIVKKLNSIQSLLKDASYWQQQCKEDSNVHAHFTEVSRDISDNLVSTLDLIRRYGRCYKPIGALETEQRFSSIMEVFVNRMKVFGHKISNTDFARQIFSRRKNNNAVDSDDDITLNENLELSVESMTSRLLRSVVFPSKHNKLAKCVESVTGKSSSTVFDSLLVLNGKVQTMMPVVGRTTMLFFTFFLCACLSISPVDYKVEPVY